MFVRVGEYLKKTVSSNRKQQCFVGLWIKTFNFYSESKTNKIHKFHFDIFRPSSALNVSTTTEQIYEVRGEGSETNFRSLIEAEFS